MRSNSYRKITYFLIFIFLLVLSINLSSLFAHTDQYSMKIQKYGILNTSGTEYRGPSLWNPLATHPWYPSVEGDPSDVYPSVSPSQGDLTVIGNSGEKQVLLNSVNYSNWAPFNKSELVVVPQRLNVPNYTVDSSGAWCSHLWWEGTPPPGGQPKNTPVMHWRTNVSLPVDMSDYIITSVDFNAIINASVDRDIDTPDDYWARWIPGQITINQHEKYDYAQFYVEITSLDIDELNTYRIAFNQTRWLGNEDIPLYNIEGFIGVYEEQAIIDALTNVLAVDPGHNNFTVVLGIYMYCEDNNSGTDRDNWKELRFKTLNLTFSYVKRIDQFTTASWNQDLNEITGTNVRITEARLEFKYKIDQNWTESSQNSQIRVYVNDRKYQQNVPLIDYVYSPDFEQEQYNIVSKLLPYENFTLSIQVFLAEDFGLEQNITISITDVKLYITYTETFPDIEPWIFAALLVAVSAGAVCLGGYFVAYQRFLKYPRPVRKVRKFKRTLNKGTAPDVAIMPRDVAFKKSYNQELGASSKLLRLKRGESKGAEAIEKGELSELTDEALGKKIDSDKLIDQSLEKKGELDEIVDKLPEKP